MSFDYNYKFWVATQKDIEDILKRQEVFKLLKPISDKNVTHYLFAELYARYVQLVNKLGYIYHHTFQVQKRDVVKNLVEAATQRVLELKNELKNLELCEFIYIDKTLIERRLTPDDVMVWTPKYFPYWRPTKINDMIYGPRKAEKSKEAERPSVGRPSVARPSAARPSVARASVARPSVVKKTKSKSNLTDDAEDSENVRRNTMRTSDKTRMRRSVEVEDEVIDPVKKRLKEVVQLIQSHERARVARKYLANIRRNPAVYKPKMRDDLNTVKYDFTHKPTQTMLLPIKRTRFEANYFVQRKDLRAFNYYVKPIFRDTSQTIVGDLFEMADSLGEEEEEDFDQELEEVSLEGSEFSEFEEDSASETSPEDYAQKVFNAAALKIQCFWKGYRDRKKYKALQERKLLIYGMAQEFRPRIKQREDFFQERAKEAEKHRFMKENYDEEFVKFCQDERARILRVRGPWIMEDISDHIRYWFRHFYDKLSCFHPYPDEIKGGTLLLLKDETMDVFEYDAELKKPKLSKEEKQKIKEKEREKKKKLNAKLKKAKLARAKQIAKLKKAGIYDMSYEMEKSKSTQIIEETLNKYKKEWEDINEKLNKKHSIIKEWITSDYYSEIHQELELIVDELMRLEFELLQRALAKDKKKKYRAPKKRKPKGKKGKRKKTPKDMTADRSVESLFHELQDAGIVNIFPKKMYDDFIGERNHCAFDILNIHMKDTPPFKGEIKDVLTEYVLGMGPLNITKPKSICLVGPTHSGKRLLCDILATEIGAVVFDISPEKTAQYENADMKYFLHVIIKMAKILQPTIIFIRNVHRVFWKKVPKEFEDLNPRILQSQMKKLILKPLKKEDKVFVLATTDAPWTANGKMKKMFQKILLVPKTEYATSFILRRNETLQKRSIPRDFDFSSLALVTREYASGDLVKNIQDTLNLRRRMQLVSRPLQPMEFLDNFLSKDPPHFPPELKEWMQFAKWYRRASKMARQRAKMMRLREAQQSKKKKKK